MGSFQSFKWPHFVILRDDFIFPATFIAQHSVHVQQHTICERGGPLDSRSHLGVVVTLKGNASQRSFPEKV
jgi:hypothetical protein